MRFSPSFSGIRLITFSLTVAIASVELPAATDVVELDEIKVEAKAGRSYYYVAIPGFELLSPYTKQQTEAYAAELQRQRMLLGEFIPAARESIYGMPQAIYLDDHAPAEGVTTPLVGRTQILEEGVVRASLEAMRGLPPKKVAIKNGSGIYWSGVVAPDAMIFYSSLYGGSFVRQSGRDKIEAVAVGYGFILPSAAFYAQRWPRWPEWAREGIETLGPRCYSEQTMQFFLTMAISPPPPEFELKDVFAASTAADSEAVRAVRRQARCLLANWALVGGGNGEVGTEGNRERIDAFWRLVQRAEREPATEQMFIECLGAEAWPAVLTLWNRLGIARSNLRKGPQVPATLGVYWPQKQPAVAPPVARPATRAELVRVRCEYEWRIGREFEATQPALAQQCLQQAGFRLRRAYTAGERDPPFLAVLALYEADAGDSATARARVEEAAATQVVRPVLYLQQARYRRVDEMSKVPVDQRLTLEQVRHIAAPLLIACAQRPVLREAYRELADLWLEAAVAPPALDLTALGNVDGVFPNDVRLLHDVAVLHARAGEKRVAQRLVEQALRFTPEGSPGRARLDQLLTAVRP